jgi:hypothetical protein
VKTILETALLIGNGLNRCYDSTISWASLLEDISEQYNVNYAPGVSFPMKFESIANQILDSRKNVTADIYMELKQTICQRVSNQKPPEKSIHKRFVCDLGIKYIMTTNYDYMLEFSIPGCDKKDINPGSSETRYSIERMNDIDGTKFYHIHGEQKIPRTLCLGYEHYVGCLSKLREHVRKFQKTQLSERTTADVANWPDLFFTHNVYIVGFDFDASEIDLWWLITYRAYLYFANVDGARKKIRNKIVLCCRETSNIDRRLLENLHIEVKKFPVRKYKETDSYLKSYEDMFKYIKNDIHKENNLSVSLKDAEVDKISNNTETNRDDEMLNDVHSMTPHTEEEVMEFICGSDKELTYV